MVLSSAAEHKLCRKVAGDLFLPAWGAVLPGCSGQGGRSWKRLEEPYPSDTLQAKLSLQIFVPGSC